MIKWLKKQSGYLNSRDPQSGMSQNIQFLSYEAFL